MRNIFEDINKNLYQQARCIKFTEKNEEIIIRSIRYSINKEYLDLEKELEKTIPREIERNKEVLLEYGSVEIEKAMKELGYEILESPDVTGEHKTPEIIDSSDFPADEAASAPESTPFLRNWSLKRTEEYHNANQKGLSETGIYSILKKHCKTIMKGINQIIGKAEETPSNSNKVLAMALIAILLAGAGWLIWSKVFQSAYINITICIVSLLLITFTLSVFGNMPGQSVAIPDDSVGGVAVS